MRILITNDDGVEAIGFTSLIRAVQTLGHEPVLAVPAHAMSGASRSRRSHTRYEWAPVSVNGARGFKLAAPPAACIVFAMTSGLVEDCDLCISGINAGENLGAELTVSGTFGATLESYSYGLRAISISRQYGGKLGSDPETWDWTSTADAAVAAINWCLERDGWRLANINLHNRPRSSEPIAASVSASSYFVNRYDCESHEIDSDFAQNRESVLEDDDIHVFESLRRTSVSLLSQPIF